MEEWAYRQMVALQGVIVPRVYGFFHVCHGLSIPSHLCSDERKIRLPHGEDAIAFVMEKINALSDADWIATSGAFGDDRKEALERVVSVLTPSLPEEAD